MIVILNFGSQYLHLIARRVRELGVYAEILPHNVSSKQLKKLKPDGIIFSGSPASVYGKGSPQVKKEIFKMSIPILGICYGHQLIADFFNIKIEPGKVGRFGRYFIKVTKQGKIFQGIKGKQQTWFSNYDIVSKLPKGFIRTATSPSCPIAAMENTNKKMYSVQFHPEVVHTKRGKDILANFVFGVCKAKKTWKVKSLSRDLIEQIKIQVGDNKILLGSSGGVDSTVVAALIHKAVGDNLYCVFVDHGLMRKNETVEIRKIYKKLNIKNFKVVNARNLFLNRLKGVTEPEKKRKIIGHTFIKVFETEGKKISKKEHIKYFAQGTIYPDRIESAASSNKADKIKSHHNLTLPEKLHFKIIEPLQDLYKDEVRELGLDLGLDKDVIYRHPFPGPGLAVRILGNITSQKIKILQAVDEIYMKELKKSGDYSNITQAFAALLPAKSVGVMGDARTYKYIVSLRAVTTEDFMTADWYKFKYETLIKISSKIVNEVKEVNRVLYDITQKPPATVEYE
ncbi:glutamine-hydrolyzing GMP synthase [Patescibacteria group bacterium]|nr:glutamine-hydrolyzing GMP synthase [Patescibacteria group bacterium]